MAPRAQHWELHKAEFSKQKCRICDNDIHKGECFVIEVPSYWNICRGCIKTLFMFLQDNSVKVRSI